MDSKATVDPKSTTEFNPATSPVEKQPCPSDPGTYCWVSENSPIVAVPFKEYSQSSMPTEAKVTETASTKQIEDPVANPIASDNKLDLLETFKNVIEKYVDDAKNLLEGNCELHKELIQSISVSLDGFKFNYLNLLWTNKLHSNKF